VSSVGRSRIVQTLAQVIAPIILFTLAPPPAVAAGGPTLGPGGPLPLTFEPNEGQADGAVRFLARGRGYGLFLSPTESVLVLTPPATSSDVPGARRPQPLPASDATPIVVRMRLVGARSDATIIGLDQLPGRNHHLIGDRGRWRRDVPTFARVRYADVYPGVSLVFYGSERELEYDVVVAPGADPAAVALAFDGADALRIDEGGDLILATAAGELRLRRPVIYQESAGTRRPVDGGYVLDDGRVRFRVAAWDRERPLIIDPVLGYSTPLGGVSNDQGFGIALDTDGNAYVTGSTISSNFPVSATPVQPLRAGVTDVFVTKLDPSGSTIVYSTFLGGSGDEAGNAIAVDAAGNAYVTGTTSSNNFPVVGAFQATTRGGNEAFVAKLDPSGSTLVYSTYIGSNTDDVANGIAIDALGNAYITGSTQSSTFPNNNAVVCLGVKSTGVDAFVLRLNASGATVDYCRFIGGTGTDIGQGIAADAAGNVWVVGSTNSASIGVVNALQPTLGGNLDGFVARLNPLGAIVYLTYLGGSFDDEAFAVAVDALGNAYVAGSTLSTNFPVAAPLQALLAGRHDAFVSKLSADGSTLLFSTYLGGTGDDIANGIAVHDPDNSVYVVGSTNSVDFPLVRALQGPGGLLDAFVAKLAPAGNAFVFSTYLGGSGNDVAQAVAVDGSGVAFITGATDSLTFPTVSPLQAPAGLQDAFVSQIADGSVVQFTASAFTVAENAGAATIRVQRTGDTTIPVTVAYATGNGTAVAGTDYQSASGTLSFASGETVKTFTVTILNNTTCQGDRTVNLTLSAPAPNPGAELGTRSTAVLTIVDDEPAIAFSAPTYTVAENGGAAVITVTRSGGLAGQVTVDFMTSDGTATAGSDYTASVPNPRTLTFAPGVRSQTVSIPIRDDTIAECSETVNLTLVNVQGGTPAACLGLAAATLTITDNDRAGAIQFARSTFTVNEPAPLTSANATVTVTRTGTGGGVTVNYAVADDTAVAGTNYTATSGTLTFAAGQTSRTFTVPILNDGASTGNLVANLALSNPTPACLGAPGSASAATLGSPQAATLTIVDREPNVSFAASNFTVREGATSAVITVRRGGSTTQAFTVDFAATPGTALPLADFTPVAGTLTFAAGVTSRTFSVPIVRFNDPVASPAATVNLTLSNVTLISGTSAPAIVGTNPATLTIVDDDTAGIIQFSGAAYTVNEPATGSVNAVITVTRSAGTAAGVAVDYAVGDSTAIAGRNYTATSGTLVFAAGQTALTFVVPILHDPTPTGNIAATLTLSNPLSFGGAPVLLGTPSVATLNIVDFEPAVAFTSPTFTVTERTAAGTITLRRIGTASVPFTVDFAASNGTGVAGVDYQATATTVTFPAGTTAKTVTVPILNNTVAVGARTVTLTLSNPSPLVRIAAPNPATLTIGEDDVAGVMQFSQATYTAREPSGGPGSAVVTVTRSGGAASNVTVDYAVSDNTAIGGTHYTPTAGTLTFGAGQTSLTFAVPLLNDGAPTGDVVADLTLSNPGGGGALGARSTAQLKILDTEATVRLSSTTYSVIEGGPASVVVERTGPAGLPGSVIVSYATSDGTAVAGTDYRATSGNLTFSPGVSRLAFTVPTIGDVRQNGSRSFSVVISVAGGTAGAVAVTPSIATVTIQDNDLAGELNFFGSPYHSSEFGTVNLSVRRASTAVAGPVTVAYTTVDGTAVAGVNYVAKSGVLTFPAGVTAVGLSISILANTRDDGDRTFTVVLSAPTGGATLGATSSATIVIADDDAGGVIQFSASSFGATECATLPCLATLTLTRTGGGASGVSVDFDTIDGTGIANVDYVPTSGTVIFNAGVVSRTLTIPLVIEPGAQPPKTFGVILSNPLGGASLGPRTTATVTVTDTR